MKEVVTRRIESLLTLILLCCTVPVIAQLPGFVNTQQNSPDDFTLTTAETATSLWVGQNDFPGVIRATKDLQSDIERVTDTKPDLHIDFFPSGKEIVVIGTIGKSELIDRLIRDKKIDVNDIKGKWETFLIQTVDNPFPNVDRALVIAGSDKRGTIFGIYDISKQIGVSPWYWWADVPPKKSKTLYIKPGRYVQGEPPVKYRGIFINDEAPALTGWAFEKFGGFNHKFYAHVYELILRMKGNFLWPAMWGRSLYDDDSLSAPLADEYGVVISTSHHEPMMRAHVEWQRYEKSEWNYEKNEKTLQEFWRKGIERMGSNESVVTLGMRGDGDEPMSEDSNIALLQRIVSDQRQILGEVTGKGITTIPQVWALYKEVQDYYDKGMRVPDDVTLLLCDDNWGNIRRLPGLKDKPRAGGYGIYYHFDYVGGPRNYKWLNTSPIQRTWEQMHLAYRYGATQIWVVNVGDIKPMEFPIEFFLDYAWNPEQWPHDKLDEYTRQWAEQQFGKKYAEEIADIVDKYTKYNGRRKPELLAPDVYSLHHYREAERIVSEYNALAERAEKIYNEIPEEYKDAYYQLVLHPVKACANLNELWVTVGKNRLYAAQGRASTNDLAEHGRKLFDKDSALSHYYNKIMAGGKWNHIMDQTHISYTYWQQPPKDVMPEVKEIEIPVKAEWGIAVENSDEWHTPSDKKELSLPVFDSYNQQTYFIELFNRGNSSFTYTAKSGKPFIKIEPAHGTVYKEQRIYISVDWNKAAAGINRVPVHITDESGNTVTVLVTINNPKPDKKNKPTGFVEGNGYISINAENFTRAIDTEPAKWQILPGHGRTSSAVTTFPVTAESQSPPNSPRLEYNFHLLNDKEVNVHAYFSPTLNFTGSDGLRYAVSIDDGPPQIVNIHEENIGQPVGSGQVWEKWVSDNIIIKVSNHGKLKAGNHTLKIWMVDSGVVLQKLVLDTGGLKPSYLGPTETHKIEN